MNKAQKSELESKLYRIGSDLEREVHENNEPIAHAVYTALSEIRRAEGAISNARYWMRSNSDSLDRHLTEGYRLGGMGAFTQHAVALDQAVAAYDKAFEMLSALLGQERVNQFSQARAAVYAEYAAL